ncbi:Cwf15 / Cwc15 cell cycle control family protein [Perilla frutescens var. hirtella]|nr:Cwf15 / Cwc15 cell cycle control family protein [Perilla frutescens var. hirtella]
MTWAARPTWAPVKGGNEQGGTRIFGPSQNYSSRDMAAHTSLKPRKEGQDTQDEVQRRNLREELEDRYRRHFSSKDYSATFHLNVGLTSPFHPPLRLPFYSPPPVLIFCRALPPLPIIGRMVFFLMRLFLQHSKSRILIPEMEKATVSFITNFAILSNVVHLIFVAQMEILCSY